MTASAETPQAGAPDESRYELAKSLASLDGVRLLDIKASVGPAEDANNWREYLGRADDLLAHISTVDTLGCESCGEAEQKVRTDYAGLCHGCSERGDE